MKQRLTVLILAAMLCLGFAVLNSPAYAETEAPADPAQYDADQDFWGLNKPLNENTRNVELIGIKSRNAAIVPVDESFTSADGKSLRLTMTGLTGGNKDLMLDTLRVNYLDGGEGSDTPIRVEDTSFIDAEKWNSKTDVPGEYRTYYYGYDANHCWAATCANMLRLSGWADGLSDPRTGEEFSSEDDIFEYYNVSFTDRGSETDRGLDWFFMGEYFVGGISAVAGTYSNQSGGLIKEFVSSSAQKQYDLTEKPEDIGNMLRVAAEDPGDRAVFGVSVGEVLDSGLANYHHAVTGIGLITDPGASDIAERYKAIILADSDNDASPQDDEYGAWEEIMQGFDGPNPYSEENTAVRNELIQYMEDRKEARPNSYTVYKLRYSTDAKGTPYWEIVGYVDDASYAIYNIDELACPSDKIRDDCRETEGSRNVNSEVDFTLDELFTTSNEESVQDPYTSPAVNAKKSEFEQGEAVNVNYFLANRSNVILNDSYEGGNVVTVEWEVTRDSDGTVVSSGSENQAFTNRNRLEQGAMLFLNKTESGYAKWAPGVYTVTIGFNKDRKFREAYYKNNSDRTLQFTITGETDPEDEEQGSADEGGNENIPDPTPAQTPDSGPEVAAATSGEVYAALPVPKEFKATAYRKGVKASWKKFSKKKRAKFKRIEVQVSRTGDFTDAKVRTAKKSVVSKKIDKLKSKKTYYVRARTYKIVGGVKYVSAWSKVRKFKVK